MSIRAKIFTGCLLLTMLSGLAGLYGQLAVRRIGQVGLDIYDNAFMAMSYLRAAQSEFVQSAKPGTHLAPDLRDDLLGNLQVAQDRAMSTRARGQLADLRRLVLSAIDADNAPSATARAGAAFDKVVETYAGDGFRYRRRVGLLIDQEERRGIIIIAAILTAAMLVTAAISRMITPPIVRAVRIAQNIAAGRLDNEIVEQGHGETADLLRALATMQAAIAAGMARIQALMDEQAVNHASEIFARNAQMEAALGNMNQGLCLFAACGALLTANRRFGEMFGHPAAGQPADAVLRAAGLGALVDPAGAGQIAALSCTMVDSRVIAITQQPIEGGGWVTTFEDVTERQRAEARLARAARHDVLTGLPNRLSLSEHLQRLDARDATVAVLALDIDRFHAVNDTHGRSAGDALLCEVAARLSTCIGDEDLVARLGSDEFAIVQQAAPQPAASTVLADRMLAALRAPFLLDGQPVDFGASIGVALSDDPTVRELATPPARMDMLLNAADLALHRAQADGGGYHYFESEMNNRIQASRRVKRELRTAIADGQLELFYQPLVKPGIGIGGFEALVRWRHPQRGLISPADFIPAAEATGLIVPLGSWILRRACSDAASWPRPATVAVNLSPLQFRGGALVGEVAEVLRATKLPPSRLQLEITEGVLLQDDAHVLTMLGSLRALGVRIAMDDFGTGYSSLGYLSRFPFDKIKIDQSFVRQMIDRPDCLAIVRAVIGLGRSLGMDVNAEGVETEAQMRVLLKEGCMELQGYLFSKPRAASEVPAMLADQRILIPNPDSNAFSMESIRKNPDAFTAESMLVKDLQRVRSANATMIDAESLEKPLDDTSLCKGQPTQVKRQSHQAVVAAPMQ